VSVWELGHASMLFCLPQVFNADKSLISKIRQAAQSTIFLYFVKHQNVSNKCYIYWENGVVGVMWHSNNKIHIYVPLQILKYNPGGRKDIGWPRIRWVVESVPKSIGIEIPCKTVVDESSPCFFDVWHHCIVVLRLLSRCVRFIIREISYRWHNY
jgi:hypothetical protein